MRSRILWTGAVAVLGLALTGCPPKKQVKTEEAPLEEANAPQNVEEPSLRGKEYKEVPDLGLIHFDLDQHTLRGDARGILQKNYEVLRAHPEWEVLVEGHCDERGTTEYNLGLGQRRAAAARQYYMSLGITGKRIATISYGKEAPLCTEKTEDCWARNRRGTTKVRINPGSSQ